MQRDQRISVVVRTYHRQKRILENCLKSLGDQTVPPAQIVLVSCGTNINAGKEIAKKNHTVVMHNNKGTSIAANLGIAKAIGDIVAFIDDDAVASPNWIETLAERYIRDPEISAVGGVVIDGNTGRVFFDGGNVDLLGRTYLTIDKVHSRKSPLPVYPYITGGNMSFRRKVLEELKGFDNFYLYSHEDCDICVRIQQAGGSIGFEQKSIVLHYTKAGPLRTHWIYHQERSRIYFILSNFSAVSIAAVVKHMLLMLVGQFLRLPLQIAMGKMTITNALHVFLDREIGQMVGFEAGVRHRRGEVHEAPKRGSLSV